jgi:putative GTP pyrophosphokinase
LEGATRPEDWGEAYAGQRRTYLGYTEALKSLFRQLLEKEGIPYVQIEARTKEVPNFVSKLRRKNYSSPLEEVTDFSGIRLVLYYLDDLERVRDLIERQFFINRDDSVDKGALLDPDRFGYLSVHYVIRPSTTRRDLPEWSEFSDLWAEVQVRTALQHAWGAISRKLAYASVREAPRDLQRGLNRLSALLELADEEFVDIRKAREEIEQQYDREVERGNLDLEVDESSLDIYLRESGVASRISQLAQHAGSPTREAKNAWPSPRTAGLEYAPAGWEGDEGRDEHEEIRELLSVLDELNIKRISQLDEKLQELWELLPKFMEAVNKGYQDSDGRPIAASPHIWLTLALLWSAKAPAEKYLELGYVDRLIDCILSEHRDC